MEFDPEKIYWQAHRGGGGLEAPDNTLYAMRYGWSLGGIPEADIRVTRDREVVCLHDNTLARTTDAPPEIADVPIGELDLAEVRKYDAGRKFRADCAGERIPTVREVFEIMRSDPEKLLYADIKNYDEKLFPMLLDGFLSLARDYGVASRIIVAGRDYALNCRFKELCPEIKTMQWIGRTPVEGCGHSATSPQRIFSDSISFSCTFTPWMVLPAGCTTSPWPSCAKPLPRSERASRSSRSAHSPSRR